MIQRILDDFWKLQPETRWLVVGQVLGLTLAMIKAFRSSKQASFFQRAHEAVVVGIEHSDCNDCREAAKRVAVDLGIESKVKPIVKAIKENI